MRGRLSRLVGALALLLSFALIRQASAQLPLLDNLSRDPTDPDAYARMPFNSLTDLPVECVQGYFPQGFVDTAGIITLDCQPIASGTPADGDCPRWDAGLGYPVWGPCGTGTGAPIVVLGDDYVYLGVGGTDKLIYYTGS